MGGSNMSSVSAVKLMEEGENKPKIAPKRRKSQEIVEKGGEDRMSELPDCLLIEILSRLPSTKYAIRTGTLSKRWKHIWTSVPTLIFDHDYKNILWSDFVSFVDKTLTQRCKLKLKKFELYTCDIIQCGSQVNNWIHYAVRCNVEELILKFRPLPSIKDKFSLDKSFFINTCFTNLTLSRCIIYPTGAISWKSLRFLCISKVNLDEGLIENILSGSPLLETLILNDCYGYRQIDITSKSLKNLVLSNWYGCSWGRYIVEIKAPNILSLTIKGDLCLWNFLLVDVSSIVEANLNYINNRSFGITYNEPEEEMLKRFIMNIRHVKELKIGGSRSKVLSRLEAKGFVIPSNIKFPGASYQRLEFGNA